MKQSWQDQQNNLYQDSQSWRRLRELWFDSPGAKCECRASRSWTCVGCLLAAMEHYSEITCRIIDHWPVPWP